MLVRPGFEPATSRSVDRRSPNWANQAAVHSVAFLNSFCQKSFTADYTAVSALATSLQWRIKNPYIDSCLNLPSTAVSLQRPISSVPKVAFVERFNYLLWKDSLPRNLFILVMQHGAHCVTRQKWLRRRLRNSAIWLHISEILFYKWTDLDWYMIVHKECFPSSKNFVWNFRNSICQTYIPATAHLFIVHSNC